MQRTDRDRWLALGLLLALLGLVYLLLVHPLFTKPLLETDARIEDLQARDARLRSLLQQRPKIEQGLAALERQGGSDGFLAEPTAELATAALIQRLEQVVETASPGNRGCVIVNRTPLEDANAKVGRYQQVTVLVRLRCGNAETLKVLHALEAGRPYLFVDALGIVAQRYFAVPGSDQPQQGGLDVSFNLQGYLQPVAKLPAAGEVANGR